MATRPEWQDELNGPRWARRMWASRGARLAFSLGVLGASGWVLVSGISDPDGFLDSPRAVVAFVGAPLAVVIFGLQLGQTVRDLVRGENRRPVLSQRRLERPLTVFIGIYAVVALAAFLLWH
jgi:hypothetical protein